MRRAVNQFLPKSNSSRFVSRKLKSRAKVEEFYIKLDKPHKIYHPGEEVSGQIILILLENCAHVRINLCLEGEIRVSSNFPLRSDKKDQLFNHSIDLYGNSDDNEQGLTSGEHRFPFIVKIPRKNVYSSIKFEKGEISYLLKSTLLTTDDELISISEKLLNIVKPINLTLLPEAHPKVLNFRNISSKKSLTATLSSTSSLNSSISMDSLGSANNDGVRIKLTLPYIGYMKGENIPVKLNIKHYKPISNMNGIIVTLIRVCKLDLGKDYEFESYRKDLTQSIVPLVLDRSTFKGEMSTSLKIPPDCFPTIISPSLSFQYFVEVLLNMSANGKSIGNNYNLKNSSSTSLLEKEVTDNEIQSPKPIVNVDNLKKMKNVLTITNEIVIGTERKSLAKDKPSDRFLSQNSSDSEPTFQINEVGNIGGLLNEKLPVNHKLPTLLEFPLSSQNLSSLRHSEGTSTTKDNSNTEINSSRIKPLRPTFTSLPPVVIPPSIDEKEMMRLNEEARMKALLPSEPPNNTINTLANLNLPPFYQSSLFNDSITYTPVPKYTQNATSEDSKEDRED